MARKSPGFTFYVDSWFLGTVGMSLEQQGIMIRLLCFQWAHGPSIAQAYVQACAQASPKHVLDVLQMKFSTDGNVFWNDRLEEERKKQFSRTNRAKSAANTRWNNFEHATSIRPSMQQAYAPAMHSDSVSVSVSDSESEDQKNMGASESTRVCYPDDFEAFWEAYPPQRRTAKKATYAKWKIAIKSVSPQHLIDRAREFASSEVGKSQFACAPEVWLNKGKYDDDADAWKLLNAPQCNSKPANAPKYKNLLETGVAAK